MTNRHPLSLTVALLLAGCPTNDAKLETTSTSASAPVASSSASSKPKKKAYDGPAGTLRGRITISGDPPPSIHHAYPRGCGEASAMYGKLFRVGQDKALADALVAVTEYPTGLHIPPASDKVDVIIRGCAFNTRTIAMHVDQHLEISNKDPIAFLPRLDGARQPLQSVTIPDGSAKTIYHRGPQRYTLLEDTGHNFMKAHTWVFPYATFDVTDLTGRYEIKGIPVGKVKVNVMLPLADKQLKITNKSITIDEGDNELDLELEFDAAKETPEEARTTPG